MPVRFVIGRAYGEGSVLPPYLIDSGPSWIESEPYDIEAVPDGHVLDGLDAASRTQVLLEMLRTLLAERFKLRAHWERRQRPVYVLVQSRADGRLGPGVSHSDGTDCQMSLPTAALSKPACGAGPMDQGVLTGYGMTFAEFARTLQSYLDRPVLDRTNVPGRFTFRLEFALELPGAVPIGDTSIFAALAEQLGVKLQPERQPVEVLVVDAIERPAAD